MFRLIADTSFSWEYFRDANGFTYVSPSCTRLTGYAPEEFLSNPRLLEEIVHPSQRESFLEHLRQASRDGDEAWLRLRLVCRDGSDCWVEHACRKLHDSQGKYLGLRCSVRDITHHKTDEERRSAYEILYRVMAELQAEKIVQAAHGRFLRIVDDINELKRQRLQFETNVRTLVESHVKLLDAFREPSREEAVQFMPRKKAAEEVLALQAKVLEALSTRSLALALICNTGRTPGSMLRIVLERLGLSRYLTILTFSDEVGLRKPHADIFLRTLAALGVAPAEAAHVGDDVTTDVAGARGVGMRAIHLCHAAGVSSQSDGGEAILSLFALPAVLFPQAEQKDTADFTDATGTSGKPVRIHP